MQQRVRRQSHAVAFGVEGDNILLDPREQSLKKSRGRFVSFSSSGW